MTHDWPCTEMREHVWRAQLKMGQHPPPYEAQGISLKESQTGMSAVKQ